MRLALRRMGGRGRRGGWRGDGVRSGIGVVRRCRSRGSAGGRVGIRFFDWFGSVHAGGAGAEPEFLKRGRVNLAAGIQAVGGLKFLHSRNGVGVPFAVGLAFEIAATRKRGLNFGNAVGRRSFLKRFAPGTAMVARFFLFAVGRRFVGRARCRGGGRRGFSGGLRGAGGRNRSSD